MPSARMRMDARHWCGVRVAQDGEMAQNVAFSGTSGRFTVTRPANRNECTV